MKEDYVIAVRSYKRPEIFRDKTFKTLNDNKLLNKMYVFVADDKEKKAYEKVLPIGTRIIIGEKGGCNAVKAICKYFKPNSRIVFMDDDLKDYYGDITLTNLIEDGFETVDKEKCGAFTVSLISNKLWTKDKPTKECRWFVLRGSFWGARNDYDMIVTPMSHADDILRTSRYLEKYGKICVFWKCGFKTKYGIEDGGMQVSGDRLDTESSCNTVYNNYSIVQKYFKKPEYSEEAKLWDMKIKPYRQKK